MIRFPGVVGICNTGDILSGQIAMDTVDQSAKLAGVNKKRFSLMVACSALATFISR